MKQPNKNTHFKVRNINGTSKNRLSGQSWIGAWRSVSNSNRTRCAHIPCGKDAEVGAHVQIVDKRTGDQWYIVPLCKQHNHTTYQEEFYIERSCTLVTANKENLQKLGF